MYGVIRKSCPLKSKLFQNNLQGNSLNLNVYNVFEKNTSCWLYYCYIMLALLHYF